MSSREYTSEELQNVIARAVEIGRMSERAAFRVLLDQLILGSAAQQAKATEHEDADAERVHNIARQAYLVLRGRYKINRGVYEDGCQLAPEETSDQALQRLGDQLIGALKAAGAEVGLGPIVETECGCCGVKILCPENDKRDRCPRCVDHKGPEQAKAH